MLEDFSATPAVAQMSTAFATKPSELLEGIFRAQATQKLMDDDIFAILK